jgi:hypothetical protein
MSSGKTLGTGFRERGKGQGREGRRDNGLKREGKDLAGSEHSFLLLNFSYYNRDDVNQASMSLFHVQRTESRVFVH